MSLNRATTATAARAEGRKAPAPPSDCGPPSVIRGAKSREVSLDWFRASFPASHLDDARDMLRNLLGGAGDAKAGLYGADHREDWAGGVKLCYGGCEQAWIEVSGSGFALTRERMDDADLVRWFLSVGGRCTRLDVALDIRGECLDLIEQAAASCERKELVGARVSAHIVNKSTTDGVVGETLYIGKRGKLGSGRFVRFYDKGLEQKAAPHRSWLRYEVEFSGDCAQRAAVAIMEPDDWISGAVAHALGAVEFRRVTRRREMALRPVVEWWAEFCAGCSTIRVVAERIKSNAASWCRWIARCVAGQVKALSELSGQSTDRLVEGLCGKVDAARHFLRTPAGRELALGLAVSRG